MHIYKTMKNFLLDYDYYIDIYKNYIHIFNYQDILKLNNQEITLKMPDFILNITGLKLAIKRLEKREILITGTIDNIRWQR